MRPTHPHQRRAGWLAWSAALLLSACATPPGSLYAWGDYQRQLYASLKQEGSPEAQLEVLQQHAEKAQAQQRTLPPGLRAQMGLLHLRLGHSGPAQALFEAEKASFPEATPYMDFLLKRMQGQKPAAQTVPSAVSGAAPAQEQSSPVGAHAPAAATAPASVVPAATPASAAAPSVKRRTKK